MFTLKPLHICRSCLRQLSRRHLTTTPFPPETGYALLTTRRIIALSGHDASHFLQGLTTANIPSISSRITDSRSSPTAGLYSAFLNASGRVLHDVFIYLASPRPDDNQPAFLIEVDAHEVDRLASHLRRFKLRAKIQIRTTEAGEWGVWSAWGNKETTGEDGGNIPAKIGCPDTRAPGMGVRIILPGGESPASSSVIGDEVEVSSYEVRRIMRGVAEGQQDILRETALPLESNIDYMGGIDFRKGCYIGQELTIRTHHTGVVRKRILPVSLYHTPHAIPPDLTFSPSPPSEYPNNTNANNNNNHHHHPLAIPPVPPPGANILQVGSKGRSAGRWLRGVGNIGLALCRLEKMTDLVVGGEGGRWKVGDELRVVWGGGGGGGRDGGNDEGDGGENDGKEKEREVFVRAFVPGWVRGRVSGGDLGGGGNG